MKYWLIGGFCLSVIMALQGAGVHATDQSALQVAPLQYVETLQLGERKRGYVDITNTSPAPVDVLLSVQGFRQTDDKGNLIFFDDPRLTAGIQLDLHDAQIPGRKTLHLMFVADGTKLPSGDVFAVIFARVVNGTGKGAAMSVRLGTLLMLTNGSPGARDADVTSINASWLQLGHGIEGMLAIKNTASPQTASGFFPDITVSVWPFGPTTTLHGPLVYAGNTRTVSFRVDGDYIGIDKLTGAYNGHERSVWVVAITGYWRWLVPLIGVILAVVSVWYLRLMRHRRKFAPKG